MSIALLLDFRLVWLQFALKCLRISRGYRSKFVLKYGSLALSFDQSLLVKIGSKFADFGGELENFQFFGCQQFTIVFIEDVLVFFKSTEEHKIHLRVALQLLRDN